MKDPLDGSAMWGENRIFSIAWGSIEAVTSLPFWLDMRNAATWSKRVPYEHDVTDRLNEPLVLGTAYPKQLLQLIDRYCLKSGGLNCPHPVPPLLPAETCSGLPIVRPGIIGPSPPDYASTRNVLLCIYKQKLSEPFRGGRLSSAQGTSKPSCTPAALPPDNLPNAQIDCSASTTTNLSEPFYGIGVTVLEDPPTDNLPNAWIVCSASTTTNLSEPFYGIGVTVLEVASGFAPQHVMSSFHALITRNALYLQQPNFSEVSRGDSVVDVYDKCLPTHWSAQPPPPQRLMPELPDEALASLKVPHCMVPSILRRILQH
jgi:hypothetical protein